MIEDESAPYDMSIHSNPSALAWTAFFREHNPECNLDDNVMLGWFANAMMAMHDHIYQSTQPEQTEQEQSSKWWYGKGVEDTKFFLTREPLSDEVHEEPPTPDVYTASPMTHREAYLRGYEKAVCSLKREPLSEDKLDVLSEANITDEGIAGYYLGFRDAEKMYGIGGGE